MIRAIRWTRESTRSQEARYGPDAQKRLQDRAIEKNGWIDTGGYQLAHSGRTVAQTPEFRAMIAGAGVDWDVLVCAYVSRFGRDLEEGLRAVRVITEAGGRVYFVDEDLDTANPADEERIDGLLLEAKHYSKRLSRRITEGLSEKKAAGEHVGPTPFGFLRVDGRDVPGPAMERFRSMCERYVAGETARDIAISEGLNPSSLTDMLKRPIYAEHVGQDLWARVAGARAARAHGGAPPRADSPDPLKKKMTCIDCGGSYRRNGQGGSGASRYPQRLHRCAVPGRQLTAHEKKLMTPLFEQVSNLKLTRRVQRELAAALAAPEEQTIDTTFLQKQLYKRHENGQLTPKQLADALTAISALSTVEPEQPAIDEEEALDYLEIFESTWRNSDEAARMALLSAIYGNVSIRDWRIVEVTLTPDAEAHGMALALPEKFVARRTGFEPATFGSGGRRSIR